MEPSSSMIFFSWALFLNTRVFQRRSPITSASMSKIRETCLRSGPQIQMVERGRAFATAMAS